MSPMEVKRLQDEARKSFVEWFSPRFDEVIRGIRVWAAEQYPDDPVSQEIAAEMMARDVFKLI